MEVKLISPYVAAQLVDRCGCNACSRDSSSRFFLLYTPHLSGHFPLHRFPQPFIDLGWQQPSQ